MTPAPLDLNNTNGKGTVQWSTAETEAEIAARLVREDREHVFQVKMRWALFVAAVFAVVSCGGVGAYLALFHQSPEIARLGIGMLASVVTGSLGYLSGRAISSAGR